jgi:spore coat protein U-like protein
MNRLLRLAPLALAAALLVTAAPARAQTATNTLTVSATVIGSCTIDPASLTFTNYDPSAGAPLDASGTITVNCTQGTDYWIGLDDGAAFSGTRRMTNGAEFLGYTLWRDAARTIAWDNADPVGQHSTANTPGPGYAAYNATVFGRIANGQIVPVGAYSDSVTMTVNF